MNAATNCNRNNSTTTTRRHHVGGHQSQAISEPPQAAAAVIFQQLIPVTELLALWLATCFELAIRFAFRCFCLSSISCLFFRRFLFSVSNVAWRRLQTGPFSCHNF